MPESTAVDASEGPQTRASIRDQLLAVGFPGGSVVLVHSSLSALGWVAGGAHAVVLALLDAAGPDGTVVMPAHSGSLSEPSNWSHPPVPESWWQTIREEMPAFDLDLTPTRKMGAIVEVFRHASGVLRSQHPAVSFIALGPEAERIASGHALENSLGEGSPLARVYDLDGWVLLLGVGHRNNTSLHLAEERANYAGKVSHRQGAPLVVQGERRWVYYQDPDYDDGDFEDLGRDFASTGMQVEGRVGVGRALLMRQRQLIDFATPWLEGHRGT